MAEFRDAPDDDADDATELTDDEDELASTAEDDLMAAANAEFVRVRVSKRKRRDGARPKVYSGRLLQRETVRRVLEFNGDIRRLLRPPPNAPELAYTSPDLERPLVRGDCLPGGCNGERPCPWVGCKHHLYLSINPESGGITFNFPDREIEDLKETCALDVAERGGTTLEEVGMLTNVTRERIRQVETKALLLMKMSRLAQDLDPDSE